MGHRSKREIVTHRHRCTVCGKEYHCRELEFDVTHCRYYRVPVRWCGFCAGTEHYHTVVASYAHPNDQVACTDPRCAPPLVEK